MTVFANKLEVSAKKQACKVIAAFPDTCFTPPQTPATPPGVPIPYPNFAMDSDLTSGSGTVVIDGGEISQENSSKWKKVSGDEAGSAPKKGLISSNKGGAAYASSWSMDVKCEGKGVARFSDMASTNHSSNPGDVPAWIITGLFNATFNSNDDCAENREAIKEKCKKYDSMEEACKAAGLDGKPGTDPESNKLMELRGPGTAGASRTSGEVVVEIAGNPIKLIQKGKSNVNDRLAEGDYRVQTGIRERWITAQANDCIAAMRCNLSPYGESKCCGKQTPHHLIPSSSFIAQKYKAAKDGKPEQALINFAGAEKYDYEGAPCICVEGSGSTKGSHGMMHNLMKVEIHDRSAGTSPTCTTQALAFAGGATNKDGASSMSTRSMKYTDMRDSAAQHVRRLFPRSDCNEDCLKAQLDKYHLEECEIAEDHDCRADVSSGRGPQEARNRIAALEHTHKQIADLAATVN